MELSPIDIESFARELDDIHAKELHRINETDVNHMKRVDVMTRVLFVIGVIGSIWFINPIAAFLISLAKTARWTIIAHHVSHRGLDRIEGIPNRYSSVHFAKGIRRWIDWMDWIYPPAWNLEHNVLHHYHTNEHEDPDFVQRNTSTLRNLNLPAWIKYLIVTFLAAHWKISYYAPNTFWYYYQKKNTDLKHGKRFDISGESFPGSQIYSPFNMIGWQYWKLCLLPYFTANFVLLPLLVLPFGWEYALILGVNLVIAEIFTNWHTFLIIVTNHAGDDLPYFGERTKTKPEFYLRQVIASVNFTSPNRWSDFFMGYLNYQIEHHLWPDLPPKSYRRLQPEVEAICKKYNVPYKKESLFTRVGMLLDLIIGKTQMQIIQTR